MRGPIRQRRTKPSPAKGSTARNPIHICSPRSRSNKQRRPIPLTHVCVLAYLQEREAPLRGPAAALVCGFCPLLEMVFMAKSPITETVGHAPSAFGQSFAATLRPPISAAHSLRAGGSVLSIHLSEELDVVGARVVGPERESCRVRKYVVFRQTLLHVRLFAG